MKLSCHSYYYLCVLLSGRTSSILPRDLSHRTYTVHLKFLRILSNVRKPARFLENLAESLETLVSPMTRKTKCHPRIIAFPRSATQAKTVTFARNIVAHT